VYSVMRSAVGAREYSHILAFSKRKVLNGKNDHQLTSEQLFFGIKLSQKRCSSSLTKGETK
jgi:hypothetical protein